jgi:putative heme transporter
VEGLRPDDGLGTERVAVRTRTRSLRPGLGQLLRLVVTLAALWLFTRAVQRVAWTQVWQSVRDLAWWQVGTLLAVLTLRQVLNAAPLALFVPGLGLRRALANDLSATLTATVAPPPSDIVLRLSMFRSWRVDSTIGLTGVTLNTLTYYIARFGAPVLGAGLAVALGEYEASYGYVALTGGLVAAAVVAGLGIAARSAPTSARVARLVGTFVRRLRPTVDPDQWARWVEGFVAQAAARVRGRAVPAALCQFALVFCEAALLVLAMRFAGIGPAQATAGSVVVALLVSYPLTALPFVGLGVLDAAVLTILGLDHGPWEPAAVAGLVIWRTCIQVVPLGVGALCVASWRRSARPAATEPKTGSEGPDERDDRE